LFTFVHQKVQEIPYLMLSLMTLYARSRKATSSSFWGGNYFHEISFDDVIVLIQAWYNFGIRIKLFGTNSNKTS